MIGSAAQVAAKDLQPDTLLPELKSEGLRQVYQELIIAVRDGDRPTGISQAAKPTLYGTD